ncbi:roadblock/LC7 domain-containing protein [Streptomyces sp. N2-109]|uniref:Roadblock/LC7 domain-containing protein n=1 Tax=Streptomyces gossypii TaxID=2883101 RepID=A0ABT2JM86_9ACTN|nr:roadblock/LC7 domain-containing protein [Streptomyces gossypii]MCT2588997.1 roadblock/LC7 domain-containing protein [Streptomyces gossypii]
MTEQQPTADTVDMTWVLNRLKEEKGVLHALLLSSEGLVLAASTGLERAVAERTAANASGVFSIGMGISEFADAEGTRPRKAIFDLPDGCILVFSSGERSALAVSLNAEMTSPEVAVASAATIKAINGLRSALSARERTAPPAS